MQAHPGVVFRSGPAGRRAGLALGPDIWEVARVFRQLEAAGDELLQQAAALTGLTRQQVLTALHYYAEYPDEIDAWIQRVDAELATPKPGARRAHQRWRSSTKWSRTSLSSYVRLLCVQCKRPAASRGVIFATAQHDACVVTEKSFPAPGSGTAPAGRSHSGLIFTSDRQYRATSARSTGSSLPGRVPRNTI
jgi:hypothetical protein